MDSFSEVWEDQNDQTECTINWDDFKDIPVPSWEYYEEAASRPVPPYRIEYAKSGRSKCSQKVKSAVKCHHPAGLNEQEDGSTALIRSGNTLINKGEIRIGSLLQETGTYSRWCHLRCWRITSTIWEGLPDPTTTHHDPSEFHKSMNQMDEVKISGFSDLSVADQMNIVKHVMDKNHWTSKRKKKKIEDVIDLTVSSSMSSSSTPPPSNSTHLTTYDKKKFQIPKPNKSNANSMSGKRFCLTGIFPEVGGGCGLSLGKSKVKQMIMSFGGM